MEFGLIIENFEIENWEKNISEIFVKDSNPFFVQTYSSKVFDLVLKDDSALRQETKFSASDKFSTIQIMIVDSQRKKQSFERVYHLPNNMNFKELYLFSYLLIREQLLPLIFRNVADWDQLGASDQQIYENNKGIFCETQKKFRNLVSESACEQIQELFKEVEIDDENIKGIDFFQDTLTREQLLKEFLVLFCESPVSQRGGLDIHKARLRSEEKRPFRLLSSKNLKESRIKKAVSLDETRMQNVESWSQRKILIEINSSWMDAEDLFFKSSVDLTINSSHRLKEITLDDCVSMSLIPIY